MTLMELVGIAMLNKGFCEKEDIVKKFQLEPVMKEAFSEEEKEYLKLLDNHKINDIVLKLYAKTLAEIKCKHKTLTTEQEKSIYESLRVEMINEDDEKLIRNMECLQELKAACKALELSEKRNNIKLKDRTEGILAKIMCKLCSIGWVKKKEKVEY